MNKDTKIQEHKGNGVLPCVSHSTMFSNISSTLKVGTKQWEKATVKRLNSIYSFLITKKDKEVKAMAELILQSSKELDFNFKNK